MLEIKNKPTLEKTASFGISAALITPFDTNEKVLPQEVSRHAMRILKAGASGLTLCGTTGEGASLGLAERVDLINAVLDTGIQPERLTLCLCATSLQDVRLQAMQGLERGIRRFLVTPAFYFKNIPDDRLFTWYQQLIESLGDTDVEIILYHIPQVTGIPLSVNLTRQLKASFGARIYGIKDSSGDWQTAQDFLSINDIATMIGDERLLASAVPLGCAGSICGLANLVPDVVTSVFTSGIANDGLNALVTAIVESSGTSMVKALAARLWKEPLLEKTRVPCVIANPDVADRIFTNYLKPLIDH